MAELETVKATNKWGSFTVNTETGLPVLPVSQRWKMVQATDRFNVLYILEDKTVSRKNIFGKIKSKTVTITVDSIPLYLSEMNPRRVQELACQLITTRTQKWKDDMARSQAYAASRLPNFEAVMEARRIAYRKTQAEIAAKNAVYAEKLFSL